MGSPIMNDENLDQNENKNWRTEEEAIALASGKMARGAGGSYGSD